MLSTTAAVATALLVLSSTSTLAATPPPPLHAQPEALPIVLRRLQHDRTRAWQRVAAWQQQQRYSKKRRRQEAGVHSRDPLPGSTTTTTIELANEVNALYFAPASLGTPPRTFLFALDTAVSEWWIYAFAWGDDPHDPAYNATPPPDRPSAPSASFQPTNRSVLATAVTGAVLRAGFQGTDIARFASRTLDRTTIDIATAFSGGGGPPVGVIGLGWPALANGQATPFWQATGANIFCLDLATTSNLATSYAYGGKLYLGPPPPPAPSSPTEEPSNTTTRTASSPYTGSITYFPLLDSPPTTWTIGLTALSIYNRSVPLSPSSPPSASRRPSRALLDSGTASIGAPDPVVSAFYARIPGAEPVPLSPGFWWYPCRVGRSGDAGAGASGGGGGTPAGNGSLASGSGSSAGTPFNVTFSFDAGANAPTSSDADGFTTAFSIPNEYFGTPTIVPASGQLYGYDGAAPEGEGGSDASPSPSPSPSVGSDAPTQTPDDDEVRCIGALYGYGNLTRGANNSTVLAAAAGDADGLGPGGVGGEEDFFIIGLPFLRSVFSVFDGTKPAIGLATRAHAPSSASTSTDTETDTLDADAPSWLRAFRAHEPDRDGDGAPGPFEEGVGSSSSSSELGSGEGEGQGQGQGGGGTTSAASRRAGAGLPSLGVFVPILGVAFGVGPALALLLLLGSAS